MPGGSAEVRLCLGEYARPVYEALLAETRQRAPQKGVVSVALDGDCVVISIRSGELSGLRAITSSFLYLAHAAYSSLASSEDGVGSGSLGTPKLL